jgi:8-oxo-dGTP diphosphatase
VIDVTCAIIIKEGRVLVTQRSATMPLPLKWEFPGGKVHDDETEEECLRREIKEELAIDIRIVKRLTPSPWDYGTLSINLIPFVCEYIAGEIHLAEHRQYLWLTPAELSRLDWAPADLPILAELLHSGYV